GAAALHRVTGYRQRPERHAVEGVGEVDDRFTARDLAGELECRLDRVGAGRAGELHLVVQPARGQDQVVEGVQEITLGHRGGVQTVGDAVTGDVVDQRLLDHRVVVPVVQHAGAGEEVQVFATVLVRDP